MKRKTLSKLARIRIFDREGGRCHLCGGLIWGKPWELDHKVPLWAGGEDTEDNMLPAHVACHKDKSTADAPVKAKTDRIRAKHIGVKKSGKWLWPKRPFPKRGK